MKLLILTQTVDLNNPCFEFFHGWLIELAKYCESIDVIALRVGKHKLPNNIKVYDVNPSKSLISKFTAAWRLSFLIKKLLLHNHAVFAHMCPEYVLCAALWAKLYKKPIILWYAHLNSAPFMLKIAEKFVNKIVSPSKFSCLLKSNKIISLQHGINTEFFAPSKRLAASNKINNLLFVGRVSPVKKIELIIEAIAILNKQNLYLNLKVIGSIGSLAHKKLLDKIVKKYELKKQVLFLGRKSRIEVRKAMRADSLFVSAISCLDKTLLEAMACQSLALAPKSELTKRLLPADCLFEANNAQSLANKISFWYKATGQNRLSMKCKLREIIIKKHSLSNLIKKMIFIFTSNSGTIL